MASTASSVSTTLSSHRKRKASDNFIEWWLEDQRKQTSVGEELNLQSSLLGLDVSNMCGTSIPSSSNALTYSDEKLRSLKASKGAKRGFDPKSDSTSSTARSYMAPVTWGSDTTSKKRAKSHRNHRDAKETAAFARSSGLALDMKKNHSGLEISVSQGAKTICQRLENLSLVKGLPPFSAHCKVSVSSRDTSPIQEWAKEASDPILYDILSPRNITRYPSDARRSYT